jgi:hypothetical protein
LEVKIQRAELGMQLSGRYICKALGSIEHCKKVLKSTGLIFLNAESLFIVIKS